LVAKATWAAAALPSIGTRRRVLAVLVIANSLRAAGRRAGWDAAT
jgi:hypothetical protein